MNSLLAPLTNKVHLTTIVLVALAFGVFRWSGGGVSTTAPRRAQAEPRVAAPEAAPAKRSMRLEDSSAEESVSDEARRLLEEDSGPSELSPAAEVERMNARKSASRAMPEQTGDDELLDGILGKEEPAAEERPEQKGSAGGKPQEGGNGGLNEIQKMLGLK